MSMNRRLTVRRRTWASAPLALTAMIVGFCVARVPAAPTAAASGLTPEGLRCEFAVDPRGVDLPAPRLSWRVAAAPDARAKRQSAYRLLVARTPEALARESGDLWDTGVVASDESLFIPYRGGAIASGQQVFWCVRVWDEAGVASAWSPPATWTAGVLAEADWRGARWIADGRALPLQTDRGQAREGVTPPTHPEANRTLRLRREFEVRSGLRRAVLHLSGLGHYELSLNGERVGDAVLKPAWSDYARTVYYDSYDVTARLRSGANAAGVVLAGGMYHVAPGRYVKFMTPFRALTAIAVLRLEYEDGSEEAIVTDDRWRLAPGSTTFSNMFGGEDYDARLETPGWDRPGFEAQGWRPATAWEGPGGRLRGSAQASPPMRPQGVLLPVAVRTLGPATAVYDLGQNAALTIRLRVKGLAGAAVKIIPAELTKEDGAVDRQSCGGGEASWNYTLAGRPEGETWEPRFFYHGSRYLEVRRTGVTPDGELPVVEALEAVLVHSDSPAVGEFACSSELFNRVRGLIRWAQRSNLAHTITDCPHRERLGWLEQYHLHGASLRYEWDLEQLYVKCLRDMADAQTDAGLIPDIAPEYVMFQGGFRDSPEWGSAYVLTPWQHYEWTGDLEPLRQHYEGMKRYVAYLGSKAQGHIVSHGLGDWYDVGPNPPGYAQLTPAALTATAFYYTDASIVARSAALLGKAEEAAKYEALAGEIRGAFNKRFLDPAKGVYATQSQCANAMPLVTGLMEGDPARAVEAIVADIRRRGNGVSAGDVGYRYVLRALADAGRSDVVFDMNHQSAKPGYGYQLERGATSLTEAWDAGRASSHNHFMLGHIMEWFYHDLAGIQPDPAAPGFRHIVIKPALVPGLSWAKATYHSIRGPIASAWRREGKQIALEVNVPANTTATVWLPAGKKATIRESGGALGAANGARLSRWEAGVAAIEIGSGAYRFTVEE